MRARRILSFVIDLFIAGGPWLAFAGIYALPSHDGIGGIVFALFVATWDALATLAVLAMQAVLFVRRGRTLGMASMGLVASAGSRVASLVWGALLLTVPSAVVVCAPSGVDRLMANSGLDWDVMVPLTVLASIALELLPVALSGGRTLSDRAARMRLAPDARPPVRRVRPHGIDVVLAAVTGVPLLGLLIIGLSGDWDEVVGPTVGAATAAFVFVAIEFVTVAFRRGTLGRLALAEEVPE